MGDLEFSFGPSPWEKVLDALGPGDSISAVQLLAMLEAEDEETVEDVFQHLLETGICLDIHELPADPGGEATALRMRTEIQLVKQDRLPEGLDENDPLRLYLEELAAVPACGDPQLLAMESAAGNEAAQAMLLNASLHRVIELAKEMVGKGVLLLDLIQEGSLGLWQSVLHYSAGDFETYRDWWIRQAMAKAITMQARSNGVGQKLRQAAEDYRSVDERLLAELGRNPIMEEIAGGLHLTREETAAVAKMMEDAQILARAKTPEKSEEESAEENQSVEDTAYFQSRQRIADMLSGLGEADTKLLTLRFGLEGGLPLSPEDTGKRLGLTSEEVLTREAAALAKLRREG